MQLGFKKRFAKSIINGLKIHTLRDRKKGGPPPIGEPLHMYADLGKHGCEIIRQDLVLKRVQKVTMRIKHSQFGYKVVIVIDAFTLPYEAKVLLATNDGFNTLAELYDWFLDGKRSTKKILYLYHWTDFHYHPAMDLSEARQIIEQLP